MKKLMFVMIAVLSAAAGASGAEVVAKPVPANASAAKSAKPIKGAETWSKRCNMTVDEWTALSDAERRAKTKAFYDNQRKRELEIWPKRCNMTVEEWAKLTPDETRAKRDAFYAEQKAKAAAKKAAAKKAKEAKAE